MTKRKCDTSTGDVNRDDLRLLALRRAKMSLRDAEDFLCRIVFSFLSKWQAARRMTTSVGKE